MTMSYQARPSGLSTVSARNHARQERGVGSDAQHVGLEPLGAPRGRFRPRRQRPDLAEAAPHRQPVQPVDRPGDAARAHDATRRLQQLLAGGERLHRHAREQQLEPGQARRAGQARRVARAARRRPASPRSRRARRAARAGCRAASAARAARPAARPRRGPAPADRRRRARASVRWLILRVDVVQGRVRTVVGRPRVAAQRRSVVHAASLRSRAARARRAVRKSKRRATSRVGNWRTAVVVGGDRGVELARARTRARCRSSPSWALSSGRSAPPTVCTGRRARASARMSSATRRLVTALAAPGRACACSRAVSAWRQAARSASRRGARRRERRRRAARAGRSSSAWRCR